MNVPTPDPIESEDLDALRHEILRLRDELAGAEAREEVFQDLVSTRDSQIADYDREVNELRDELARTLVSRLGRAIERRRKS